MKRKLLIILILIMSAAVLNGQTKLLWKYSDSGTKVYILGSIHIADNEILPLDNSVYEAWDQCGTLVMEVDMTAEMAASQMLVMQYMVMPDGKKLSDIFSEKEMERIQEALSDSGIPFSFVQTWYPWLIQQTIIVLAYQNAGMIEAGIDMHFAGLAHEENKPVIGLETAEEQIRLLGDLPLEFQAEMLMETVKNMPELRDEIDNLIASYKNEDFDKLEELLEEETDSPESAELLESLLADRNKNWVGQIEKMISEGGTYFIVVGAAHLLGKDSVIELLAEKGYIFSNK